MLGKVDVGREDFGQREQAGARLAVVEDCGFDALDC
jgi:hypothetical protein